MGARGRRLVVSVAVMAAAGLAAPATAQQVHPFVTAGVGLEAPRSGSFEQSVSFPYRLETASERSTYHVGRGLAIDVGGGVMITQRLGVAAAFGRFTNAQPADYTLTLPHPLIFNMPTTHSSTTGDLRRVETAVHIDAVFEPVAEGPFAVMVFAGPSRVRVTQPVIKDVQFTEGFSSGPTYDFTLDGTDLQADAATAWGLNAGGALVYFIQRDVGIGAIVRVVRARVQVDDPLQTALQHHAVSAGLDAGGTVVAVGVHVRF